MQAAANLRYGAEFALKLARCTRQFISHPHKAAQRTTIDRAAALRPSHNHLVADIVENFTAIIHDRKGEQAKRAIEKAVNGDPTEPLCQSGRPRDIDEKHEAAFFDRARR